MSKEELCYILDIDPELYFQKVKILKNEIAKEFIKYPVDLDKLKGSSSEVIKKYLTSLKHKKENQLGSKNIKDESNGLREENKELKKNINVKKEESYILSKKDQKISPSISKIISEVLLEEIKLFNNKKLSSMLSLKQEYSAIYQKVLTIDFDEFNKNNNVKRFKYYFEHFDLIEKCVKLINEIKNQDLIDKFHYDVMNNQFSDSKSNKIILEFKKLYLIVYKIKEYPYCLKDKIIDEFNNLEYFIQNYERLLDNCGFKTDNYITKIEFVELIKKASEFTNKKLDEMVSSKREYSEIYQEISSRDIVGPFNKYYIPIAVFIDYYEFCEKMLDLFTKIKQDKESIDKFCIEIDGGKYLSNSKRIELINEFKELYELAIQIYHLPEGMELEILNELNNLECFIVFYESLLNYDDDQGHLIKKINEKYIENEINQNEEFFKDINDDNKKKAIVTDEDNVKVVAGAGAGKTFIIQKKINYLVDVKKKDPERILCLCYTRKSVNQLSKRVNKHSDSKVKVFTFHEFCRQVSKDCHKINRPNRYLLDDIIRKYVFDIVNDSEKLAKLSQYFSYYSLPQSEFQVFDSQEEYEEYRDGIKIVSMKKKFYQCKESLETIKGEYVKSLGELLIANYLFMHDIEYEYERNYPYYDFADMMYKRFFYSGAYFSLNQISNCSNEDLVNSFLDLEYSRRLTRPDFYIPEKNLYLEHFGVDENMEANFLKGDAKEKYELAMKSKRIWHEMYETKLIETYHYYLAEDRLLIELEDLLEKNGVTIGQIDKEKIVDMLIKNSRVKDFDNFSKLVKDFINIYESKNQKKADFNEFRSKNIGEDVYTKNRQNLFFDIAEEIYDEYYEENKKGTLSHNHEILNALNLIQSGEFKKQYDYIFIDEYQDINQVRCKLLQELQKSSNAKIFVVGDDWQSIYGFSGSEVELFTNFDKYFKNPEVIKIKENRRNPQKLIDITSDFITKNERQDKKDLKYYKAVKTPNLEPIKIVKYLNKKIDYSSDFREIDEVKRKNRRSKILKLDAIIDDILKYSSCPKILILGRNNDDIDDYVGNDLFKEVERNNRRKIIYYERQDLDITYMTIHQSKGLECDEVILINLEDAYAGFPNKMEDDPILSFVKSNDECEFAEERRLLYVALTRTRNNVYLLTPSNSSSIFIKYLMKYGGVVEENLLYRYRWDNLHRNRDFLEEITIHSTNLDCPNPKCEDGKIAIIENHKNKTKYVRCNLHPRDSSHYDGGPYPASLNDVDYVKKCPKCRGILVRRGNILQCCLNYNEGCMEIDDKLELDIEDLEYDYE